MNKVRVVLSTMLLVLVAACGQNRDNTALQPGMVGVGPMGAGVDIRSCQVGQVFNETYGCMNRANCQIGQGSTANVHQQYQQQQAGVPVTNQGTCVAGTVVTEEIKFGLPASLRFFGTLQIVNKAQFNTLMQYAGICNPYSYGFTFSMNGFNSVTCNTYTDRGAFVVLKAFGGASGQDSINLQFGAGTTVPYDLINVLPYQQQGYGQQQYTNSYMYRSFSQQSRLYSINGNTGISLAGINHNGQDVGLVLTAQNGNLGMQTFEAQVVFQGVVVATVQLQKF